MDDWEYRQRWVAVLFLLMVILFILTMVVMALPGMAAAEERPPEPYQVWMPVVHNWRPTPEVRVVFDAATGMVDIDVIDATCRYIDIKEELLYSVQRVCSYLGWMYYPSTLTELTVYVHYPERVVPVVVEGPWVYGE